MRALVLTFDHLPLSFLACYGNTWIETPHLDRVASRSIVFDGCFSAAPPAASPIPPWWSGQIMPTAGGSGAHLVDLLRASGVRTTLCRERGSSSQGAVVFDELREIEGDDAADAPARDRPCAKLASDAIACWQRSLHSPEPSLLWVASRGVPSPWLPPREIADIYWEEFFDSESLRLALAAATGDESLAQADAAPDAEQILTDSLRQLADTGLLARGIVPELPEFQSLNRVIYAAYVSAIDAWCGTLLDAVDDSATDDLLLLVTAAAGDVLAAHPCIERGCPPLVNELVHVPLLMRIGPGEAVGSRRGELVSTADLPATLAAWFQLEGASVPGDGLNLLKIVRCDADAARDAVLFGTEGIGWGVRTAEFSCLCASESKPGRTRREPGRPWLFLKPDDVGDYLDVAEQNPATAESLARHISAALLARFGNCPESDSAACS